MFLVDRHLRPVPIAVELLAGLDDPRLTTEIARFYLEANITPRVIAGNCFTRMEQELNDLMARTRERAAELGADVLLAGILPNTAAINPISRSTISRPTHAISN